MRPTGGPSPLYSIRKDQVGVHNHPIFTESSREQPSRLSVTSTIKQWIHSAVLDYYYCPSAFPCLHPSRSSTTTISQPGSWPPRFFKIKNYISEKWEEKSSISLQPSDHINRQEQINWYQYKAGKMFQFGQKPSRACSSSNHDQIPAKTPKLRVQLIDCGRFRVKDGSSEVEWAIGPASILGHGSKMTVVSKEKKRKSFSKGKKKQQPTLKKTCSWPLLMKETLAKPHDAQCGRAVSNASFLSDSWRVQVEAQESPPSCTSCTVICWDINFLNKPGLMTGIRKKRSQKIMQEHSSKRFDLGSIAYPLSPPTTFQG